MILLVVSRLVDLRSNVWNRRGLVVGRDVGICNDVDVPMERYLRSPLICLISGWCDIHACYHNGRVIQRNLG